MTQEQHPFTSNRWKQQIVNQTLESEWYINKDRNNKVLSFGYMPEKNIKSIFLGSFPIWEITFGPSQNINTEFFYGSIVNDFWNCLANIFDTQINNINKQLLFLQQYKLGITDILETVNRNPDNCNRDNCLTAVNYNNILNLKKSYPSLENIFITSGGKRKVGNINSNKNVASWLKDSVLNQPLSGFNTYGFVKNISINKISFNLIYLFSPSNAANIARQRELNINNNFGINDININEYRKLQWGYFLKKYHFNDTQIEEIDKIYNQINNNQALLDFFK